MDTAVLTLPAPPSPIWIGSYEFRVVPCERGDKRLEGNEGLTVFDSTEIFYDATRPARQAFDTVWHELTHAVNDAFGLKLKSTSARKNDEQVATVHGHAWTQVLLQNPSLVAWLDLVTNLIRSQQETLPA